MSGPALFAESRRGRRGAALTLVFAGVLVTAAAASSWSDEPVPGSQRRPATTQRGGREDVERAAEDALADGKSPTEAAERAVSRSGDRWGAVYSEGEYAEFEEALDGAYTGVGLWVRHDGEGRVEVARVQPGGPADRAGVRAGDRLRSIAGHALAGRPVTEVVALLRGDLPADGGTGDGGTSDDSAHGARRGSGAQGGAAPFAAPAARPDSAAPQAAAPRVGSPVSLGLERDGRTWRRTLHRARLSAHPVTVTPLDAHDAVLIKVDSFTKGVGRQVRDAVREAPPGAGILLDLRGNSGGLVTEATEAASAFLDGGLVATYDVRGAQRALHAHRGGDTRRPLVTLVDGGTMSAAELLTGALQDRGRAVVVGSRTFGKGTVQMPSRLPDGAVAELTVGHYRTPSGRSIDGRGISPDLEAGQDTQGKAETVLSGL